MGSLKATFYEQALETAPDGFIVVDANGVIHFVNCQAEVLFGWSRDELVGQPVETIVPDRVRDRHPKHRGVYFAAPVTRPMAANLELSARRKDGSEFPVDISLSPLQTDDGLWVSAAIRDATARKASEKELLSAYERLTATVKEMERRREELAVVSEMGDMLQSCLRAEEAYAIIAAASAKLFTTTDGVVYRPVASQGELESVAAWGSSKRSHRSIIVAEDCWALRRGRLHRRFGDQAAYGCRHSDNSSTTWSLCVPLLAHGEMLGLFHLEPGPDDPAEDAAGRISEVERLAVTVAEHLSLALANLKLRENLRIQSERDALTGLFNRRYLDVALQNEVVQAARDGEDVAMMLIDIDGFKRVNDTFSHLEGDARLRAVANILLCSTRGPDIACRYGGDELAVILPGASLATASERAEAVRARIEAETDVRVSIGVSALRPTDVGSAEDLLRACDVLLGRAKANGKNQVVGAPTAEGPQPALT